MAERIGTPEPDTISGNHEDDVISGLEGNDTLAGGPGDDIVNGGPGHDALDGGAGIDVLIGGIGDDTINGGAGYDLIAPGGGNDTIDGGEGVDTIALTGRFLDYVIEELSPHSTDTPGRYRVIDRRTGAQEGTDTFTGIENLRFETGGELTLADMLNRAPTAIALSRTPLGGPEISEAARSGALVAVLSAVDRDPGDSFTYAFSSAGGTPANAGGRFAIEGDKLVLAAGGGIDFDVQSSYTVTVVATDRAGNSLTRAITITVREDTEVFNALFLPLPGDAEAVRLWELDEGGYMVTWLGTHEGQRGHLARHVTESGATFIPEGHPEGAPPPADRFLATAFASSGHSHDLLGVDDEGIAALSLNKPGGSVVSWVDLHTGRTVRSETLFSDERGLSEHAYAMDDGFVLARRDEVAGGEVLGPPGYGGAPNVQLRWSRSTGTDSGLRPDGMDLLIGNHSSWDIHDGTRQSHSEGPSRIDVTEDGTIGFVQRTFQQTMRSSGGVVTQEHEEVRIAGRPVASRLPDNEDILSLAVLDEDTFAVLASARNGATDLFQGIKVYFHEFGRQSVSFFPRDTIGFPVIEAIGSSRYLVSSTLHGTASTIVMAQIFDASGTPVTEQLNFPEGTAFTVRDNGTVVAYRTATTADGLKYLDGQVSLNEAVVVTPAQGAFSDRDGDGDLDYAGMLTLGHRAGVPELLRLEGGTYELASHVLKVRNATVFAEIGKDRSSALFKGSFDLDRDTGVASNFVTSPLPGSAALQFGGLDIIYKGLNIRKEAAAFTASLALPDGFFDTGAKLELGLSNALLIDALGPQLDGFEIPIPPFAVGGAPGGGDTIYAFNLFEAKGKNLKIRYDAAIDELGITGELEVKSDIIDGLGAFIGLGEVGLKFTELKIKEGKYDFAGEFSAKSWNLALFKLKDIKIAVRIDDDVVQSIDIAAGIDLPIGPMKGLSFAGQALNPPMTLNKFAVTAETEVPLPQGFFLDSISASLTNMAGSPPEPTPLPTTLSGGIGIGWGFKIPSFRPPAFFGVDEVQSARLLNTRFSLATDFTSSVSATGSLNIYKDEVLKLGGTITWDWQRDAISLSGEIDLLSGFGKGTANLKASALGFTASGAVSIAIPPTPEFSFLAGTTLASGNLFAQYLGDADKTNDYIAGWATYSLPVIGTFVAGVKLDFHTLVPTPILGANDLPKTNSFDVAGTEDWLMIAAAWQNPAAGPVATRVRTPQGTFIAEADYAANGITVLGDFTGANSKTIVIDNPRAGNWDLQVIDPAALGTLAYKGYTPNPPVGITVADASLAAGAKTGTVGAEVSGADPGTRITFWADTDDGGLDGFALGGTVIDADGTAAIDFDATLLSKGDYFIYAVADDGRGIPAFDYSAGAVTVAHRATAIGIAFRIDPLTAGGEARIGEDALPGTEIGTLRATSPDRLETFSFALVDDAGGRFALLGDRLVVGSAAPFDATVAARHTVVLRATSAAGLSFDDTILVEIAAGAARFVHEGEAGLREVRNGLPATDIFHAFQGGDIVAGGDGEDTLYLSGLRDDFRVDVDPTGAVTGPIYKFIVPADAGDLPPLGADDPPPPFLVIRDLRDPDAPPVVASGIEFLQFLDQRVAAPANGNTTATATGESYAVAEDGTLVVDATQGLLGNDRDPDGDATSAVLASGARNGLLALNPDGSFEYRPHADFSGPDSFAYYVFDGRTSSAPAIVTLAVNPVNDAPTAPPASSVATAKDTPSREIAIGARDADGDPLAFAVKPGSGPAKGSIGFDGGAFVYTPFAGAVGDDAFVIVVSDGKGGSAQQSVSVSISDANVAPSAPEANTVTTGEDTASSPVAIAATDSDGDELSYSVKADAQPAKGSVQFAQGRFTYTPRPDANGTDSFVIVISDGRGGTIEQSVAVTITPVNDAPFAPAVRTLAVEQGRSSAAVAVGASDVDGDPLAFAIDPAARPAKGEVRFANGGFVYTPASGATGDDAFVIVVSDGKGGSTRQTVNVTIAPAPVTEPEPEPEPPAPEPAANQPPVADQVIHATTREDTAAAIRSDAIDPEGGALSFSILSSPSHGRVTQGRANGTFEYRPDADFHGADGFTIMVDDGNGGSALQQVAIVVSPVNDAPVLRAPAPRLPAMAGVPRLVRFTATDVDDDALSWAVRDPRHGSVLPAGQDGTYIYTPAEGHAGLDSFGVTASDGKGGSATATIEMQVLPQPVGRGFLLLAGTGFAGSVGGTGTVVGTAGGQDIALRDEPGTIAFDASFNRGADVIRLPRAAMDYLAFAQGSRIILSDGDSLASIPLGAEGAILVFGDGARALTLDTLGPRLGNQAIGDKAAPLTAPAQAMAGIEIAGGQGGARLFLEPDGKASIGGNVAIFGTNGRETVAYLNGTARFDPSFNRGGDRLELPLQSEHYTAVRSGSTIVLESRGGSVTLPVGTGGMEIAFADGSALLSADAPGDRIMLGTQAIGWTAGNLLSLG